MFVRELHASSTPYSRANGANAVAKAAYRAGERLHDEREGVSHDYSRKPGVVHCELIVPDKGQGWATSREAVWNQAEQVSDRKNALVAREWRVGLPHELDANERRELAMETGRYLVARYGVIADVAIHEPDRNGDQRNHHAHILLTTRQATESGLGARSSLEWSDRERQAAGLSRRSEEMKEVREAIADMQNRRLRDAGHDVHVEHRSFRDRGIALEPDRHVGAGGTGLDRMGRMSDRADAQDERREANRQAIEADPSIALHRITEKRATFTRQDIARELNRHFDDPDRFLSAMARIEQSAELIKVREARVDEPSGAEMAPTLYSTKEMAEVEARMLMRARDMSENGGHSVDGSHVEAALQARPYLSDEQRAAVQHVTDAGDYKVMVGVAGGGKSKAMEAAREAWETEGFRVHGAALSGIAAENLQDGSGIDSRTLASWQRGLDNGTIRFDRSDVIVIDEAGMVGSRQYERFLAEAQQSGAKIVSIGDWEQLQNIDAGAGFRATAERVGYAEITEVRRQGEDWQRQASTDFSRGDIGKGFDAYEQHGRVHLVETNEDAKEQLVEDWAAYARGHPSKTGTIYAHRRADVGEFNERARTILRQDGKLGSDHSVRTVVDRYDQGIDVRDVQFAKGDRIMFLQNDRRIGVKNGTVGTVTAIDDQGLTARLADGSERSVVFKDYRSLTHGYASTVHKAQGSTVDRSFVYMDRGVDRHLAYVAMTRHRQDTNVYASRESFRSYSEMTTYASQRRSQDSTLDYRDDGRSALVDPVAEFARMRSEQNRLRSRVAAGDPEARERMAGLKTGMRKFAEQIDVDPALKERARDAGLSGVVKGNLPERCIANDRDVGFER